jgi:hypothetical protein
MSSNPSCRPTPIYSFALLFLAVAFCLISSFPAFARSTDSLFISTVDLGQFPKISLDVQLSAETFSAFPSLTTDQVRVIEEGNSITPDSVNKVEPGIQTILAVNAGSYMALDYQQKTLYQHTQEHIVDWLAQQPNNDRDDYSFTFNSGNIISHMINPQILIQSFSSFKPNLLSSVPSLQALSSALILAVDPLPRPAMQRVILYVTVSPDYAALQAFPSLIDQAARLGVKVFVWLIAPPDAVNSPNTPPLLQLANETGGDFFLYSGRETFPDLEPKVAYLRSFFQMEYSSLVRSSGSHQTAVKLMDAGNEWVSPQQSFQIELLSPNVFFLSPVTSIQRIWQKNPASKDLSLNPSSISFQVKTEFPDGHPRSLQRMELLVDGELVQEFTQGTFDLVTWVLSGVTNSGEYFLQIRGQDSLGFEFLTAKIPVEIQVDPAPRSFFSKVLDFLISGPVVAAVIILGSIATLAILIKKGKIKINLGKSKDQTAALKSLADPLTQPVAGIDNPRLDPVFSTGSNRSSVEKSLARLVRLNEITQEPLKGGIINIGKKEVTFGSDSRIVSVEISSPSVSPIHARIFFTASGAFRINDLNSSAGTWVNFAPVSAKGAALENGDLVHIGKLLYRFEVLNRSR